MAQQVLASGRQVVLPWGNDEELSRAKRIADGLDGVIVLPKMGLNALNAFLANAQAVIGVDTGLSHVVAALEVPSVAIYGATDAVLTGVLGPAAKVLASDFECAPCLNKQCNHKLANDGDSAQPPCYRAVPPQTVFAQAEQQIRQSKS